MVGDTVTLGASGSEDVDGEQLADQWAFDDGATASGERAGTRSRTPGDHAATVTVTDPTWLSASATVTVPVQAAPGGGAPAVDPAPVLSRLRLVPSGSGRHGGHEPRGGAAPRSASPCRSPRAELKVQAGAGDAGCVPAALRSRRGGREPAAVVGPLRRRPLAPGRFWLLASARDNAGQRSAPARARFRIVPVARVAHSTDRDRRLTCRGAFGTRAARRGFMALRGAGRRLRRPCSRAARECARRQRDLQRALERGSQAPPSFRLVMLFTVSGVLLALTTVVLVVAQT